MPIPPAFQYFSDPTLGGYQVTDYCPAFQSDFIDAKTNDMDCRDTKNADGISGTLFPEAYGEYHGSDSMCFENNGNFPICYRHQCDSDTRRVYFFVGESRYECDYDFQDISVPVPGDYTTNFKVWCPRLAVACPHLFCPNNCEGRGHCNWESPGGPKCECFDATDTTESCSESPFASPPDDDDDPNSACPIDRHWLKLMLLTAAVVLMTMV